MKIGDLLGPYRVLSKVGEGGMGEVYRAHDPRIGRDVAIKVLPAGFASDPERLRRFQQEARATGLLNHPNILTIYDTGALAADGAADGAAPGAPFIVTELLEGRTLRDQLRSGPIRPTLAIDYAIQIARGLAAAHAKAIVHRDLKPENLFIVADERVKILDFGIAKLVAPLGDNDVTLTVESGTRAGHLIGTLAYMSPEQARGAAVDARSDLFSFGLIVYEMLAGAGPSAARAKRNGSVRCFVTIRRRSKSRVTGLPHGIETIVRRCLEKSPDRRFQSATDVVRELEWVSSTQASTGSRSSAPTPSRMRMVATAIVTALILVAVGTWLATRQRARQQTTPATAAAPRALASVNPFLASDAIESNPAWSPSGNLIAYVSDAAGNHDIWICDPSGSNPINLTAAHGGTDSMPAWSPDSARLAFFSDRDGGGIFTMNALGGDVRRVLPIKPGVLYTFSLTWSKTGSLVYTNFDDGGHKNVYRVAVASGTPMCLTCDVGSPVGGRSGELSASGELLLYKSSEMGTRGPLLVLHLASGKVAQVLEQADMPRWSADGRHIVFLSSQSGTPDLWQVEIVPATGARNGEPERLTSGLAVSSFALAPDSRQILAVTEKSHANLWSFPATVDRIDDLAQGQQWTTGQFMDTRGRWLPDGAGVVFQSNRRGSLDIWTLASAGGAPQRLTTAPGPERRPRISPDGQWIAFDMSDSAGEYMHVMRRDGSGVRLPDATWPKRFSMTCCADWSPDGRRIAMHVNNWTSALVQLDPATGAASNTVALDLPGGAEEYHRWSPDGALMVYEAVSEGSWDLWVARADGSGARRLTTGAGSERSAAWHPRLPFLFYEGDAGRIWRVGVDSSGKAVGVPHLWLTLPGRLEAGNDSVDFTRAGDRVLVTVLERGSDIWLVER